MKKGKIRLDVLLGIILLTIVGGVLSQTNIVRTVEKQYQEISPPSAPAPAVPFVPAVADVRGPRHYETEQEARVKTDVKPKHEVILEKCFGSLASIQSAIPEVRWIEFDCNYVHIGFNPIPSDVRMILGGHAFAGWQAINFGCHIYAYDASKYGSRKYGASSFAGATCRYGKTKHY